MTEPIKLEKKYRIHCRLECKDGKVWFTTWKHAVREGDARMACMGKSFRKTRELTKGDWLVYAEV